MAQVPVVDKDDNKRALLVTFFTGLIVLFLLFFIKWHEPDPPKVTVPIPITMAEEGFEDFEIYNAGGGAPAATETTEQTTPDVAQEQPVQEEPSPVSVNQGASQSSSESSSNQQAPASNPFSGSGSGGSGTSGTGGGFGPDSGPGVGTGNPGTGSGDRIRLNNLVSKPKTKNSQACTIALILTVDFRGNVISVRTDRKNTTTTNTELISEIQKLVRNEVKYNTLPDGIPPQQVYFSVAVSPN